MPTTVSQVPYDITKYNKPILKIKVRFVFLYTIYYAFGSFKKLVSFIYFSVSCYRYFYNPISTLLFLYTQADISKSPYTSA